MKKNNILYPLIFIFIFSCSSKEEKKDQPAQANKVEINKDSINVQDVQPTFERPASIADLSQAENGDIIMQSTTGLQSNLVSIITKSPYSHCGLVFKNPRNEFFVLEAFSKIEKTPLKEWVQRGKGGKVSLFRLNGYQQIRSREKMAKATQFIKSLKNLPYDSKFLWGDDEFYCSELVWKIYKNALDIELCTTRRLKDYDLSDPAVQAELKVRYGNEIPFEEPMVAPSDIAASEKVTMIYSSY